MPYGVIAVSLSRTMFTEMAESAAKKDLPQLRNHVKVGLSTTIILILPLAALMCVFSEPIMSLFRAGNFNSNDVATVASVLEI